MTSERQELGDLDDLLGESLDIAKAKRDLRQGRKLTEDQKDTLKANDIAVEVNVWQDQTVYCHTELVTCECGHKNKVFRGWYKYQTQRKGTGRRLVETEDHENLPAGAYFTERSVTWCEVCGPEDLNIATLATLDILSTLGEPAEEDVLDFDMAMEEERAARQDQAEAQGQVSDSDEDGDEEDEEDILESRKLCSMSDEETDAYITTIQQASATPEAANEL